MLLCSMHALIVVISTLPSRRPSAIDVVAPVPSGKVSTLYTTIIIPRAACGGVCGSWCLENIKNAQRTAYVGVVGVWLWRCGAKTVYTLDTLQEPPHYTVHSTRIRGAVELEWKRTRAAIADVPPSHLCLCVEHKCLYMSTRSRVCVFASINRVTRNEMGVQKETVRARELGTSKIF